MENTTDNKKEVNTMKELTTYNRAVQYCTKLEKLLNEHFFDNELPHATVTIQSSGGATFGHLSISKVWVSDKANTAAYELNLSADFLDRPIENICATLLHEMTHEYCLEHKIKDTSGYYHNKRFKEVAEQHGLSIEHDQRYGWTITSPNEKLIDWIIGMGLEDMSITRNTAFSFTAIGTAKNGDGTTVKPIGKSPNSHSQKWQCPFCKTSVRSTKIVNIICGDCMVPFERVD